MLVDFHVRGRFGLEQTATKNAASLADPATLHAQGNVTCDDIIAEAPKLYGSAWTE